VYEALAEAHLKCFVWRTSSALYAPHTHNVCRAAQLAQVPPLVMHDCHTGQLLVWLFYCALYASLSLYALGTRAENMSRD
jgi:hypothetical protein